ncbi:hypothetical protein PQZ39_00295 [bacterium]|nr:hypothetical protein [bacterium]
MSDSVTKWEETNTGISEFMSDREIMNAKSGKTNERKASEILKKEYPTIYSGYMAVMEEQLELFSKKHLDYGMSNISAGTSLSNKEERDFALAGLWYRMSDKINRWKNLIVSSRGPQNETIIDTFQDVCNYAIIAQLVERNQWKK